MPSEPTKPKSHPSPPADLNNRPLPIERIRGPWIRFYWVDKEVLYFNKTNVFRLGSLLDSDNVEMFVKIMEHYKFILIP